MGIGEFPQQAENRFRVTKALLATFVRKQYPYPYTMIYFYYHSRNKYINYLHIST